MNGEMFDICMLVSEAKNIIMNRRDFDYHKDEYVNNIKFTFLPVKSFLKNKVYETCDPKEWIKCCIKSGAINIKMLVPLQVENREILGFSNTNRASIVLFHKNSRVTYWTGTWTFNQDLKKWDVEYKENIWENPPTGTPKFENNREEFANILTGISQFADEIGFKNFGNIFREAKDILDGKKEIPHKYSNGKAIRLPNISDVNKRLFYATSIADVFGAMGSWNDSPPYYAHEKGLDDKYNTLSNELLKQIRYSVMYSINED